MSESEFRCFPAKPEVQGIAKIVNSTTNDSEIICNVVYCGKSNCQVIFSLKVLTFSTYGRIYIHRKDEIEHRLSNIRNTMYLQVGWMKDGNSIKPDKRHIIRQKGTKHTLTISATTQQDLGDYSCEVSNDVGTTLKNIVFEGEKKFQKDTSWRNICGGISVFQRQHLAENISLFSQFST